MTASSFGGKKRKGGGFSSSTRANKAFRRGGSNRGNFFKRRGERGSGNAREEEGFPGVSQDGTVIKQKFDAVAKIDAIDEALGFPRFSSGNGFGRPSKYGWLVNMHSTLVKDPEWAGGRSAVDLYFIQEDGKCFKSTFVSSPYFYVLCKDGTELEVEGYVKKTFGAIVEKTAILHKDDLDQNNHLVGVKQTCLKIQFRNTTDLMAVRKILLAAATKQQNMSPDDALIDLDLPNQVCSAIDPLDDDVEVALKFSKSGGKSAKPVSSDLILENVLELREYDIPFHLRMAIDFDIRVGYWYHVTVNGEGFCALDRDLEKAVRADPVVLAFDIETTKLPLKFPDSTIDSIMMISYMINGQGYLITNREIVSEDIDDFEYTPKPEFPGPFTIFNEADEKSLLERFFAHIQEVKPSIFVTYNGDNFDWPFVEARCSHHGINMYAMIGFSQDNQGEYKSTYGIHMDAMRWVKRDSYLPVGSQGLKAVTTAKLGYSPDELDPEDMTRFAHEQPHTLASYSVSDAVATYYLYMKYVHPFIFSLCNIIPLNPDEVLRKGSGTLCETLLMVEAFKAQVIMPNKEVKEIGKMYKGHMLESETYVGGHVEALESGVFRSDIATLFSMKPRGFQQLLDQLDRALKFSLEVECKTNLQDIVNYNDVYEEIATALEKLRDQPRVTETPLIYHLDVAAMYPNIILTNRLQPSSIVDERTCASCDYNKPGKQCQRPMEWSWRGQFLPATSSEYKMIKNQLENEKFPSAFRNGPVRSFFELSNLEQNEQIHKRLIEYSKKVYKKAHEHEVVSRTSIVCMRENAFYVDTVRNFRDRRYEYKGKHKEWKKALDTASKSGDTVKCEEAKKLIVLYDSLQLAHKCILNSFYGYVMRKGARWYSMEMAGIVCQTGAEIIKMARELIEQIGRPLELDTDGIWCMFPGSFPENFDFTLRNGKKVSISYPCVMLNHLVHEKFTNHQYQYLVGTNRYEIRSENSIFFEIDGPYRAMILPASKEEGKLLKKRYAVFNHDGSVAELKGFEVKRRGELNIIKLFQKSIFKCFLEGDSLVSCYEAVAKSADHWIDILDTKGFLLEDSELFDLISENRSMSRSLDDYGDQKSTSISTAKRLAEFLGDEMVKDKGLACQFVISEKPLGAPIAERAVPVAIFNTDPSVTKHYLRKWLKDPLLEDFNIRNLLDWSYYKERLGSVVQKLISIPAAMQNVSNPVPRIPLPDWVGKKSHAGPGRTQLKIEDMFARRKASTIGMKEDNVSVESECEDIENVGSRSCNQVIDIEDSAGRGDIIQTVGDVKDADADTDADENEPRMIEDYRLWLNRCMKPKWRKYIKDRKSGDFKHTRGQRKIGLGDLFERQTKSMIQQQWQVISVTETAVPGVMKLWVALEGDQMISIKVNVPKIVYANSRVACDDGSSFGSSTEASLMKIEPAPHCRLPRSRRNLFLYRITMDEREYQDRYSKDLFHIFTHPNMEGVYEKSVPSLFRCLLNVGCVSSLMNDKRGMYQVLPENGISVLDMMRHEKGQNTRYLLNGSQGLSLIYVHHAKHEERHVFGVFEQNAVDANSTFHVFIIDPSGNRTMPNMGKLFGERLRNKLGRRQESEIHDEGFLRYVDNVSNPDSFPTWNVTHGKTLSDALNRIQKILVTFNQKTSGVKSVLLESSNPDIVISGIKMLYNNEIPIIELVSHQFSRLNHIKRDNIFIPAVKCFLNLDWQKQVSRRMIDHYLEASAWLTSQVKLARYCNIPVGNISNDPVLQAFDVVYARSLVDHNFVLWYSDNDLPDLAGRERDEYTWMLDYGSNAGPTSQKGENVIVQSHSSCKSVTVELEISNLAINTMLESHCIPELENLLGAAVAGGAQVMEQMVVTDGDKNPNERPPSSQITDTQTSSSSQNLLSMTELIVPCSDDENIVSKSTFHLLRHCVRVWSKDAVTDSKEEADIMLSHFYRWIKSGHAKLYDPMYERVIQMGMQKVLLRLISHFQGLGSRVIFADLQKILVQTPKQHVENAIPYIDFLQNDCRSKGIFSWINIEPIAFWDYLLFMDRNNYAGFQCRVFKDETHDPLVLENVSNASIENNDDDDDDRTLIGSDDDDENFSDSDEQLNLNGLFLSPKRKAEEVKTTNDETSYQVESIIDMNWSWQFYLPTLLQEPFRIAMAEYVQLVYDTIVQRRKMNELGVTHTQKLNDGNSSQAANSIVSYAREDRELDEEDNPSIYDKHLEELFKTLSMKLMKFIREMQMRFVASHDNNSADAAILQFPNLPCSRKTTSNANGPLEFVKMLSSLYCVEPEMKSRVLLLRRNMLSLLSVKEFSETAIFENPCYEVSVPNVVCESCSHVWDVDLSSCCLGRNGNGEMHEISRNSVFQLDCPVCETPVNPEAIELSLISRLNRRLVEYHLQDLVCKRCHRTTDLILKGHCECSGPLQPTVSHAEMNLEWQTIKQMASFYRFSLLEDFITSYLY